MIARGFSDPGKGKRAKWTFNKLSTGAKVVLGGTIAFLIVSFFSWFKRSTWCRRSGAACGTGFGISPGSSLIALLAWEALRLANVNVESADQSRR